MKFVSLSSFNALPIWILRVLALLQEEVLDRNKTREVHRSDSSFAGRASARGLLPLPLPPQGDKLQYQQSPESHRHGEPSRGRPPDDKLTALRAYRRAKGLCIKCAEKWSRDHKCPDSVQLHVIQELYDMIQFGEEASEEDCSAQQSDHLFLTLSEAALTGADAPKTMRFKGSIQGQEVLILIDSGSSNTFVSAAVAEKLSGLSQLSQPLGVLVANGSKMQCDL